jgi:hypothetical protein
MKVIFLRPIGASLFAFVASACAAVGAPIDEGSAGLEIARAGHVEIDTIVMGNGHMCALLRDATVRCFGGNRTELLCDQCRCSRGVRGAGVWSSLEHSIPSLEGVVGLSAAASHTCAVIRDGSVRCWGGAESSSSTGANSAVNGIAGITDVVEVTTQFLRTCARLGSGDVRCWGGPVAPNDPNNFVAGWFGVEEIAASPAGRTDVEWEDPRWDRSENTVCARTRDGSVNCEHVTADCRVNFRPSFSTRGELQDATDLALAKSHLCGSRDGALQCAVDGALSASVITTFAPAASKQAAAQIATTGNLTCAVDRGQVSCTALDDRDRFVAPRLVAGIEGVVGIAMGAYRGPDPDEPERELNACALRKDGGIVCWQTAKDASVQYLTRPFYLPLEP